jgi:subtilase family serine protease
LTIAIVDAYDDPAAWPDLQKFDQHFGLPDPAFRKVNQTGGAILPAANNSWAQEIALDVEWAHTIAPAAAILLVEANSNNFSDLLTAVRYAASLRGVGAVSMRWGGGEFSSETANDSAFATPGVVFIASSGDAGAPVEYPGHIAQLLAVGGTSLSLSGQNYVGETGWSGQRRRHQRLRGQTFLPVGGRDPEQHQAHQPRRRL